jgi:hypothetical protein
MRPPTYFLSIAVAIVVGLPTSPLAVSVRHHRGLTASADINGTPGWTAESDQASSFFGTSVASAGDVNGDAYDDVIVGADFYDNGQIAEGRAFVYHGSAAGLSTSPSWTAEPNQAYPVGGAALRHCRHRLRNHVHFVAEASSPLAGRNLSQLSQDEGQGGES